MTGLDTNVLVRYLAQDDPLQSELATDFIEKKCTAEKPGFINLIVLCELTWVLKRAYKAGKDEIVIALAGLLSAKEIVVERAAEANKALAEYIKGEADYVDYLIAALNSQAGCSKTVTFDKKAAALSHFKTL